MNKNMLLTLLQSPIAFHPVLARAAGGAAAGLFLSQLFYWSGRGGRHDGWIWKDAEEWQAETCLTSDEQRTARKKLQDKDIIEVSDVRKLGIDKFKTTLCFRIDFEVLYQLVESQAIDFSGGGEIPLRAGETPTPKGAKSHSGPGKPEVHTTKNTTKNISKKTAERDFPLLCAALSSLEKEERDLARARARGKAGGLAPDEIDTVLATVQFPSQAPAAVDKEVARRRAAQEE